MPAKSHPSMVATARFTICCSASVRVPADNSALAVWEKSAVSTAVGSSSVAFRNSVLTIDALLFYRSAAGTGGSVARGRRLGWVVRFPTPQAGGLRPAGRRAVSTTSSLGPAAVDRRAICRRGRPPAGEAAGIRISAGPVSAMIRETDSSLGPRRGPADRLLGGSNVGLLQQVVVAPADQPVAVVDPRRRVEDKLRRSGARPGCEPPMPSPPAGHHLKALNLGSTDAAGRPTERQRVDCCRPGLNMA